MNLLAITQHTMLLERLRTAFEGAGHTVTHVPDHLHALASEAWHGAHLMLVDAAGEPLDGYRLCHLLRAESRSLFRNLPIFLILDHPPAELDQERLREMDGDGFVEADASIQNLLDVLGPLMEGALMRGQRARATLLALGLPGPQIERIAEVVKHLGFELQVGNRKQLARLVRELHPPILFMGLGHSIDKAQATLQGLSELPRAPYPILVGGLPSEAGQRRLLTAGAMDWLTLPLSAPMMLHACRKAVEWTHVRRIQGECQAQIKDLLDRSKVLELETSALHRRAHRAAQPARLHPAPGARGQPVGTPSPVVRADPGRSGLLQADQRPLRPPGGRPGAPGRGPADRVLPAPFGPGLPHRRRGVRRDPQRVRPERRRRSGREDPAPHRRTARDSGQNVFPTMSFGVGAPDGSDGAALFARVDQALYLAKRKGRNRIEVILE